MRHLDHLTHVSLLVFHHGTLNRATEGKKIVKREPFDHLAPSHLPPDAVCWLDVPLRRKRKEGEKNKSGGKYRINLSHVINEQGSKAADKLHWIPSLKETSIQNIYINTFTLLIMYSSVTPLCNVLKMNTATNCRFWENEMGTYADASQHLQGDVCITADWQDVTLQQTHSDWESIKWRRRAVINYFPKSPNLFFLFKC